jgi:hypothetical protein
MCQCGLVEKALCSPLPAGVISFQSEHVGLITLTRGLLHDRTGLDRAISLNKILDWITKKSEAYGVISDGKRDIVMSC